MKKLIITSLILLNGCISSYYLPEVKKVREIELQEYSLKNNNCVDKSIQYSRHLNKLGIENRIVSGHMKGSPKGVDHAWVEVKKEDKWYLVDATWSNNNDGFPIEQYNRKAEKRYWGDLTKENKQYKMKLFWIPIK